MRSPGLPKCGESVARKLPHRLRRSRILVGEVEVQPYGYIGMGSPIMVRSLSSIMLSPVVAVDEVTRFQLVVSTMKLVLVLLGELADLFAVLEHAVRVETVEETDGLTYLCTVDFAFELVPNGSGAVMMPSALASLVTSFLL